MSALRNDLVAATGSFLALQAFRGGGAFGRRVVEVEADFPQPEER